MNFLPVCWAETRRVDGLFGDSEFFSVLRSLESREIDSSIDSGFFAIAWLESRTVFTLCYVDI